MISSCAVIIRKPYAHEGATLGLRAAWAMHSSGSAEVTLVLMGDGVFGLLGKEGYIPNMYKMFLEQDGPVYAVKEDLAARGVPEDLLPQKVVVVPASGVSALVQEADAIMSF